jgi:hypothetical protein
MKPKLNMFFTREGANRGATFKLTAPDGTATEVELNVIGFESDAFSKAVAEKNRGAAERDMLPEPQRAEAEFEATLQLASKLVTGWNYEEPFERAAIVELLRESPYIRRDLENFCSERQNFLGK